MSFEELGFARSMHAAFLKNPHSSQLQPTNKNIKTEEYYLSRLLELEEDSFFTFPYDIDSPGTGQTRTVKLERVLFRSNGVLGRGTTVVRVECACARNICCRKGCNWKGKKLILTLSYPGTSRVSEHEFMERCKELATGDHAWVLNHQPEIYYTFDIPSTDESPQQRMCAKFRNIYQRRVIRGMIQEELKPLSSLETARECAQVFYDVVQCHRWVWKYPKILHRDISQGDVMVRVKDGVKYGVLSDWDLASWEGKPEQGPTSQFWTGGTKPYMAHEQQRPKWKGPHRYRHDLESVFYVMTLFTFLYSTPSEKVLNAFDEDYHFERWHQKDDEYLGSKKHNLIGEPEWDPPVTTFFTGFHSWLHALQRIFYFGFYQQSVQAVLRQQQPNIYQPTIQNLPAKQEFDDGTLGDYVSYDSVVFIIHQFEGTQLVTHDPESRKFLKAQVKSYVSEE
ncbi:hypothetical protein EV360DRAFT_74798 [Lentinula raphanica]|nr:hypothetical protein EV360DRAFT_74798 [Lentinula raphanica]